VTKLIGDFDLRANLKITSRDVHKPCLEIIVTFIIDKMIKRGVLRLLFPS
jgi:hypothetical protein